MKVLNVHSRILNQPKAKVAALFETLSTDNDQVWPNAKWPAMKFKGGIQVGAKGGHGPIRYTVEKYDPSKIIQFRFTKPSGFNGIHKFEIEELNEKQTEVKHTIDMKTDVGATLKWVFAVRSLHNALTEDGFDMIEKNLKGESKRSEWNRWVRFLRKRIKARS